MLIRYMPNREVKDIPILCLFGFHDWIEMSIEGIEIRKCIRLGCGKVF